MDIGFSEITSALLPQFGGSFNTIVSILEVLLYIMFFLNLFAFFMQDDKQIMATMLVGLTMLAILVGKLSTYYAGYNRNNPIDYFDPDNLVMLIINSVIFVIPFIVAGMSKAKAPKPLTIIAGVVGAFYFGMYWFFLQLPGA